MEPTDSEKHVEVTEHKQPEEKDTQATKTGG
jgi:tryptophanyl-tRNA synthetase